MAKSKSTNKVHTFGKINKYFIFFGLLVSMLNIQFVSNAGWYVRSNNLSEATKTLDEFVKGMNEAVIINTLTYFGIAALLIQLNHTFAKRNSKAVYAVSVVSAFLLIYAVVSTLLMFNY